jgi:hypothetical protein
MVRTDRSPKYLLRYLLSLTGPALSWSAAEVEGEYHHLEIAVQKSKKKVGQKLDQWK